MWGPLGYGSKEHTLNHRFWSRHPVVGAKFDPNGNVIIKYFFWVCFLIAHPEIHYRAMVAQIHWTAQLLPGFLELYYHCHSVLGSMQDESSNMSLLWQARDPSAFSQRTESRSETTNMGILIAQCFPRSRRQPARILSQLILTNPNSQRDIHLNHLQP
jgi:hypothetical protein